MNLDKKIIIVGKRSNLTHALSKLIDGVVLVASSDIKSLPDYLVSSNRSSIIYNHSYRSSLLNRRDSPVDYALNSLQRLAEFTAVCRDMQAYIDKVIFTSSASVYGNNSDATEIDQCIFTGLYPAMKYASETFLKEHLSDTSVRLVIARVFNLYGGNDEFSVVSKVANAILHGTDFFLANQGRSVRDFIHIKDVADIYLRLIASAFTGVVNVGSGSALTISNLIRKAEIISGRNLKIVESTGSEVEFSVASTKNLMAAVGSKEFYSVDQYLKTFFSDRIYGIN